MRYSIIVISMDESSLINCIKSIEKIYYDHNQIEIICAIGNNPSIQRNKAALKAKGKYLIFLDNDSIVEPHILINYDIAISKNPKAKVIGGPSVFKATNQIELAIKTVLTSSFGQGLKDRGRYNDFGKMRKVSENNMISCNLFVEKKFFLEQSGFDSRLYPAEDICFLAKAKLKTDLIYQPASIIKRRPRKNLYYFFKQMFDYGNSRINYYFYYPDRFQFRYLFPCILLIYSILLPFIYLKFKVIFFFLPLILYIALILYCLIEDYKKIKKVNHLILASFVFYICHIAYGLGSLMWPLTFIKKKLFRNDLMLKVFRYES